MYSNKNFEKQALYGLAHHSSILEKNASISIPYYKDSKKIYLLLVLETHLKNQSVTININGTDVVNSLFSYNRVVLIYKIKNIIINSNKIF